MESKETEKILKRKRCAYCNKPIHISKFAGITTKGFVCSNIVCLFKLAQEIKEREIE